MNKNPVIYNPTPEDTSGVQLSEDVLALCEEMAKNTHGISKSKF